MNTELARQHAAHVARQERLYPVGDVPAFRDLNEQHDAHALLWRWMQKPREARIVESVARAAGISVAGLRSRARLSLLALPRQIAMYLLRLKCNLPFYAIAFHVGRADHKTALHAFRKIKRLHEAGDGPVQQIVADAIALADGRWLPFTATQACTFDPVSGQQECS